MKKVLIFIHVETEGPGTLSRFMDSMGVRARMVRLYEGENPPGDATKYDAIISMGGPMNVDEDDRYPFLKKEVAFLKRAVDANVPVLGICLGAQLIAKACGGRVKKMDEEERGWKKVFLTDAGKRDSLFQNVPEYFTVFQWHEDTFDIPYGGELLAAAQACPHQAFRYRNAYGLQFHIEITGTMIEQWFDNHSELQGYMNIFNSFKHEYYARANRLYENFVWFADLCRQSSGSRNRKFFDRGGGWETIIMCGIVGIINMDGHLLDGSFIREAIRIQRERGNGLGGGLLSMAPIPNIRINTLFTLCTKVTVTVLS